MKVLNEGSKLRHRLYGLMSILQCSSKNIRNNAIPTDLQSPLPPQHNFSKPCQAQKVPDFQHSMKLSEPETLKVEPLKPTCHGLETFQDKATSAGASADRDMRCWSM